MANIIHKIGETLGVGGGQKEGDKHAVDQHKKAETHQAGDYKEGGHGGGGGGGIMDKVKNQIHGGSSADKQDNQQDKKKKDKKKDKKKHGDDKHGDSSSSDSD